MKPGDVVRIKASLTIYDECECCGRGEEVVIPVDAGAKVIYVDEDTQTVDFEIEQFTPVRGSLRALTFTLEADDLGQVEVV